PIIEWKTEYLGTKPQVDKAKHLEEINQNVVIRSNGKNRYFSTLMGVLSIFDKDDLNVVYQLVMDRYQDEIPEGFNRVLWGDLMIMFNLDDEDKFWNSQQDWNVVSWKLHGSSGVHALRRSFTHFVSLLGSEDDIPPPPPPPPSQTPTQQTPHTVSTIKLPILKKREYDI
ncbi:hypothetical protein Tco_0101696, partial [Tanacetum coccineum]